MQGLTLRTDNQDKVLELVVQPEQLQGKLSTKALYSFIAGSEYSELFLFEESISDACHAANDAAQNQADAQLTLTIGERRDAEVTFRLSEDEMTASLSLSAPCGGKVPDFKTLVKKARETGIKRGLGVNRIRKLLHSLETVERGAYVDMIIAKGLPARNGKHSRLKPLVPNALERVLRPQTASGSRVDMRNLGEIVCVKPGTPVLKRLPPTEGRPGYTITGTPLDAEPGEWQELVAEAGTEVSEKDENVLVASIAGMPKFRDQKMIVDDTYTTNGVNVGTGNVKYNGAVLVNGDVTEKMEIEATGDITINGFVESATIQSGGDIIITEGAMGKVNDAATEFSTRLIAQGSIHIQHGQGLEILCSGNVTIGRQLAYSKIICGGSVIVGPIDNPNGNLFACEIQSQEAVVAGTLGAVSGSSLAIDFSNGFNVLLERKDTLDDLLTQLRQNNERHREKLDLIRSKYIPAELQHKLDEALAMFKSERSLLNWMESKAEQMRAQKEGYQQEIKLIANKKLYPGVTVKLNNRTWRAEREYGRAVVKYEGHKWHYEPLM
ncbi:DUF342 domain-containing protein [Aestuariibacter salexigens]|uniref:DUF342 domain-containing protein n=1 Tax=Aestuariibacter salexigens TaxID=226010 RepID=UPI0004048C80|nr:FapA family protein [Aestuariibacter salexigens]